MSQSNLIELISDFKKDIVKLQRELLDAEEKIEKIEQNHKSILLRTKCYQYIKGYRQEETELTAVFHNQLYKCVKVVENNSGEVLLSGLLQDNIEVRNLLNNLIED